jgi:hypothetical protein
VEMFFPQETHRRASHVIDKTSIISVENSDSGLDCELKAWQGF